MKDGREGGGFEKGEDLSERQGRKQRRSASEGKWTAREDGRRLLAGDSLQSLEKSVDRMRPRGEDDIRFGELEAQLDLVEKDVDESGCKERAILVSMICMVRR